MDREGVRVEISVNMTREQADVAISLIEQFMEERVGLLYQDQGLKKLLEDLLEALQNDNNYTTLDSREERGES